MDLVACQSLVQAKSLACAHLCLVILSLELQGDCRRQGQCGDIGRGAIGLLKLRNTAIESKSKSKSSRTLVRGPCDINVKLQAPLLRYQVVYIDMVRYTLLSILSRFYPSK